MKRITEKECKKPTERKALLLGTWIHNEARTEYKIEWMDGKFKVSGVDALDGEGMRIENIRWDGKALCFTSVMPSNGWVLRHKFKPVLTTPSITEHESTFFENWTRKSEVASKG